jgi:hypothetical protein
MSLHPHALEPVPEDTTRVARAAFPTGHPSLTLRDALGTIFQDNDFAACFPITTGQKLGQNHRFQTWPDGLTDVVVPQRLVAKKRRKVVSGGRFNVEQSPRVVRRQWCGSRMLR